MCRNRKTVNYMNNDCSNATNDNDSTYDNHQSHQNTDDNKYEQLNIFSLEANHNNSKDIWKVSLTLYSALYTFVYTKSNTSPHSIQHANNISYLLHQ